jgi:hypothetical protein
MSSEKSRDIRTIPGYRTEPLKITSPDKKCPSDGMMIASEYREIIGAMAQRNMRE